MTILVSCVGIGLILIGIFTMLPPQHCARLWLATKDVMVWCVMIICLVSGSGILVHNWLVNVTATAPRAGALWRGQVPGYDLGLDVYPPTRTEVGAVELWLYPHDADDIRPLLRLYGAPALPTPSRPVPAIAPPEPLPTPTQPLKQV